MINFLTSNEVRERLGLAPTCDSPPVLMRAQDGGTCLKCQASVLKYDPVILTSDWCGKIIGCSACSGITCAHADKATGLRVPLEVGQIREEPNGDVWYVDVITHPDASAWPVVGFMPSHGEPVMVDEVRLHDGRDPVRIARIGPLASVVMHYEDGLGARIISNAAAVVKWPLVTAAPDKPLPKDALHDLLPKGAAWTIDDNGTTNYSNMFHGQTITSEAFKRFNAAMAREYERAVLGDTFTRPNAKPTTTPSVPPMAGLSHPDATPRSIYCEVFYRVMLEGVRQYQCISVMGETRDGKLGAVMRSHETGDVVTVACDEVDTLGCEFRRQKHDADARQRYIAEQAAPKVPVRTPLDEAKRLIERKIAAYDGPHHDAFARAITGMCEWRRIDEVKVLSAVSMIAAYEKRIAMRVAGDTTARVYWLIADANACAPEQVATLRNYLRALGHDVD